MPDIYASSKEGITIEKFIEIINSRSRIDIKTITSTAKGMQNKIYSVGINRPGLSLTGFTEHFAYRRTQMLGKEEISYLRNLEEKKDYSSCEGFFSYNVPCCIVSYHQEIPPTFLKMCEVNDIPILSSSLSTSRLVNLLIKLLDEVFAPSTTLHGTLMEIFGVGILIQGRSGVGKSESALELIERGSRLIADDLVKVKRIDFDTLQGEGADIIKHHMEIRGVGIINIQHLFGVSAIRSKINIDLIIYLEEWKLSKEYERLGLDDQTETILDIKVPFYLIPVRPGRNMPIIIESATRNFRLKSMGYNAAKEFNKKLIDLISK